MFEGLRRIVKPRPEKVKNVSNIPESGVPRVGRMEHMSFSKKPTDQGVLAYQTARHKRVAIGDGRAVEVYCPVVFSLGEKIG